MKYEVIATSVHDRSDLLNATLRSMWLQIDLKPERILVHEDVRDSQPYEEGRTRRILDGVQEDLGVRIDLVVRQPGNGMGQGVRRLLSDAKTQFVLYTQEDFDYLRPIPVADCLRIMEENDLHHVRFNKRKTLKTKGADRPPHEQFHKVEVQYGGQTFCISDHWYFQTSLWRREVIKEGFDWLCANAPPGGRVPFPEMGFNRWYNTHRGGDVHLKDPKLRQERLRTFIWGGVGEPAFIKHTGGERRTHTSHSST